MTIASTRRISLGVPSFGCITSQVFQVFLYWLNFTSFDLILNSNKSHTSHSFHGVMIMLVSDMSPLSIIQSGVMIGSGFSTAF